MENRLFAFLSSQSKPRNAPRGQATAEQAAEVASRWVDDIELWIARNPKLALGAGLAIGVMVGWIVKRRR